MNSLAVDKLPLILRKSFFLAAKGIIVVCFTYLMLWLLEPI